MGIVRKTASVGTLGLVSFRSKKERLRRAQADYEEAVAGLGVVERARERAESRVTAALQRAEKAEKEASAERRHAKHAEKRAHREEKRNRRLRGKESHGKRRGRRAAAAKATAIGGRVLGRRAKQKGHGVTATVAQGAAALADRVTP